MAHDDTTVDQADIDVTSSTLTSSELHLRDKADHAAFDSSVPAGARLPFPLDQDQSQEWALASWAACSFQTEHFLEVMHNLIKNPNIMSSHLFRADIMYDSGTDKSTYLHKGTSTPTSALTQHLKPEFRYLPFQLPTFEWQQTIVRELIPRNRKLDHPMTQTCHIFQRTVPSPDATTTATTSTTTVTVYLPHVTQPTSFPFYHPQVQAIAFLHYQAPSATPLFGLHLLPLPGVPLQTLDPKLTRTVLRLSQIILKHAHGAATGYVKRVHHDVLVPQRQYQETYARLKETYAVELVEGWREVTDPGKHVFEDLAIAAWLIEVWRGMYGVRPRCERDIQDGEKGGDARFPGFVDVGCGNGLLVYLLRMEGYEGVGIDGRSRKSWEMYPEHIRDESLTQGVLVPWVLSPIEAGESTAIDGLGDVHVHDGRFNPGTFIISNHADELTAWTPLLAYLNDSPFVAIPCCSHDFTGKRFRAPTTPRVNGRVLGKKPANRARLTTDSLTLVDDSPLATRQAAETGSLKDLRDKVDNAHLQDSPEPSQDKQTSVAKTKANKGQVSAYASLCEYVSLIAREVGYNVETEMLRIPSTRNACVLGKADASQLEDMQNSVRAQQVQAIITRETGLSLSEIRKEWLIRAGLILCKKSDGH